MPFLEIQKGHCHFSTTPKENFIAARLSRRTCDTKTHYICAGNDRTTVDHEHCQHGAISDPGDTTHAGRGYRQGSPSRRPCIRNKEHGHRSCSSASQPARAGSTVERSLRSFQLFLPALSHGRAVHGKIWSELRGLRSSQELGAAKRTTHHRRRPQSHDSSSQWISAEHRESSACHDQPLPAPNRKSHFLRS